MRSRRAKSLRHPPADIRRILSNTLGASYGMKVGWRLERWLKDPWWPPGFLRQEFHWRRPVLVGVVCSAAVTYFAAGPQHGWVLLLSLNVVIYIGIPFLVALLMFWKSSSNRGRLIAGDLAACLLVVLFLIPGNILGMLYVSQKVESTKETAAAIVAMIESYQVRQGRLPATLADLERGGEPLPAAPLPVGYRADLASGIYELKVADPACLFECYWVYLPAKREWFYVGG